MTLPNDSGAADGSFRVRLHKSGKILQVGPDDSLLDVLNDNGVDVPSSCRAGICGTCEVPVLAGTPDHQDFVLSPEEAAVGDRMFACVSRCIGEELVLDL